MDAKIINNQSLKKILTYSQQFIRSIKVHLFARQIIAPLNFKIQDEGDEWMIQIQGKGNPITITAHDAVEIPIKRWRQLLHQNQGGSLSITVSSRKKENGINILPSRGMYPLIPLIVT